MKPVTLEDGDTVLIPNPPGYWWAALGRIAESVFRDCHTLYEIAVNHERVQETIDNQNKEK